MVSREMTIWAQWVLGMCLPDSLRAAKKDVEAHKIPSVDQKDAITVVSSATLKKGDIVIKGGSEKDIYIKSMKLNGKSYESTWIDWDQLNSGATIEYRTSGKPDMKWGAKVVPPSFP